MVEQTLIIEKYTWDQRLLVLEIEDAWIERSRDEALSPLQIAKRLDLEHLYSAAVDEGRLHKAAEEAIKNNRFGSLSRLIRERLPILLEERILLEVKKGSFTRTKINSSC